MAGIRNTQAVLSCLQKCFTPNKFTTCLRRVNVGSRYCSSVEKSNQTPLTDPTKNPEYQKIVEKFKDVSNPDENWYFHGYNPEDREEDQRIHNRIMFFSITLVLVCGTFVLAYMPDQKNVHWRQREAYLELARREAKGLPLIDPDLVPADKLAQFLPTDEELGDTEIII